MTKADLKTKKNNQDVDEFINSIKDKNKKKDTEIVLQMMKEITGERPMMWGSSIVGFGDYDYKYSSGREGSWFKVGFSPRKRALTLYLMSGFSGEQELMAKLGKHKTGKSCLYIKKIEDVDMGVLRELIKRSFEAKSMGENLD